MRAKKFFQPAFPFPCSPCLFAFPFPSFFCVFAFLFTPLPPLLFHFPGRRRTTLWITTVHNDVRRTAKRGGRDGIGGEESTATTRRGAGNRRRARNRRRRRDVGREPTASEEPTVRTGRRARTRRRETMTFMPTPWSFVVVACFPPVPSVL